MPILFIASIITCILSELYTVDASSYSKLCPLSESLVVQLEYDSDSQQFTVINSNADLFGGTRSLRDQNVQVGRHLSRHTFRGAKNHRSTQTKTKYTARRCPCDTTGETYCLVDSEISTELPDTCGISQESSFLFGYANYPYNYTNSTQGNATIECFDMASQTVFIRNAWPVIVLWYGALVIFFVATANGKYAQLCIINSCCPCFRVNERYVDRALRREEEMRSRLRSLQTAAERAHNIADGPGRFLRRAGGMRVRRNNLANGEQLTPDELRDQAMRAWIEAAETFGILNARAVSSSELSQHNQPMEYVLRTKKFDAQKERERRNIVCIASTPTKTQRDSAGEECCQGNGPSTPDTVATNGSDDSHFDFNETDDASVDGSSRANEACDDLEAGTAIQNNNEATDEADSETFDCTICLSEVCDGEDVGVLTCRHIFHVDCLREWMLRRNACPLCQTKICTPRPAENINHETGQNSSEESDNSSAIETVTGLPSFGLDITGPGDSGTRPMPGSSRLYIATTSLPDFDVREPGMRRSMSGTMTSSSRSNRRDYNRGRARRQQIEDPFSFAGW